MLTFIIDSLQGATLMDLMKGFEAETLIPVMDISKNVIEISIKIIDGMAILL